MSEEILKALTQLFAIISKQDGGVSEIERNYVIGFFKQELDLGRVTEYVTEYDRFAGFGEFAKDTVQDEKKRKSKRTAVNVKDSVRILGICRKINKTLNQKQKVIVLVKLYEMLASDQSFTDQKIEIVKTVSEVFNIPKDETELIEKFITSPSSDALDFDDILRFDEKAPPPDSKMKFIDSGDLDGEIIFIQLRSVGLYFTKYTGNDSIELNNLPVNTRSILQFAPGSVFKTPKGAPLYYSDLVSTFNSDISQDDISFTVKAIEYKFPNGHLGIRDVSISEGPGRLIGIMGASGAGKTTLLNVMAGLESPSKGEILLNGVNIHTQKNKIEGVIGYIAQDDLLIEELTVYQNLFYNAKLCFKGVSNKDLDKKVIKVLASLGLDRIKDLKVGSVLNKKISGGQRKRLNIALELIREPAVLFVDEPTSGLSSRDSENVIDLLKELSLKGKLIFVVIHQPSSDIYKMFDKMLIMDTGGYQIFYGNPIEAITYFKTASQQASSEQGQCPTCGNVNVEQLFNIIEAKVVDEYGEFTNKRKVEPPEWNQLYIENIAFDEIPEVSKKPPKTLLIPSVFKQTVIFTVRDFLSKVSNTQYLSINLLEAPALALLLSWIIRYRKGGTDEYVFRENENLPAYILICIIIALFMGLTVSAEEIIRDRKIQKRESFLNLSRFGYLFSKILILFALSAAQTLSFAVLGNFILDVEGLTLTYWLVLFSVACHANVLGLNISSGFNSAVTVYIIIPLLLIPQLILSGLIFDFDKLNSSIREKGKVPFIADVIASRWAYEALAVEQFKENPKEKYVFDINAEINRYSFKTTFWNDEIYKQLNNLRSTLDKWDSNDSIRTELDRIVSVVKNELLEDKKIKQFLFKGVEEFGLTPAGLKSYIASERWTSEQIDIIIDLVESVTKAYQIEVGALQEEKETVEQGLYMLEKHQENESLNSFLARYDNSYLNNKLEDLVTNEASSKKMVVHEDKILQLKDLVYLKARPDGYLDYRSHLFAYEKHFMGKYYEVLWFNVTVIWIMTLILFITLYFELLSKGISALERFFSLLSFRQGKN